MEETAPVVDESTPIEMTFRRNVVEGKRSYEFTATATAIADGRTAICIRSGPADSAEFNELAGVIDKDDLATIASVFKAELAGVAAWHGIHLDTNERTRNYAAMRARHPNAYLLWKEADDERLLQLRAEGRSVREIAKELGRPIGGIHRRLEKHGEHV